jgi:outer membrane receptor protein involved in Fe transport
VSEEKEDAIDLGIEYVKETETIGTFTGNLLANYTPNFQLAGESGGFSQQSGQGSFGPAGKGNVGVVWRGPKASWSEKFSFGPTFNYWSAYHDVLLPSRVVGDWWTVDLQATYELPWETTLTVGMLNVADRDAPRSLGQNGEGYDNTVADNRGRFTYFRVNKKF